MGNYYSGMMNATGGSELRHHGILGQKWGVRRFQNKDGSLTNAGRERYGYSKEDRKQLADLAKQGREGRIQLHEHPAIKEASKNIEKEAKAFHDASIARDKILEKIPTRLDPDHSDWTDKSNDPLAIEYRKADKEYYKAFNTFRKAEKKAARQLMGYSGLKFTNGASEYLTISGEVANAIGQNAYSKVFHM